MPFPELLGQVEGFQWDAGNRDKNWHTHQVSAAECEEIFFNQPLVVATDDGHSLQESRFYALGRTDGDRRLFAVFALRSSRIRIISARDMSRKERNAYQRFQTQDDEKTHG